MWYKSVLKVVFRFGVVLGKISWCIVVSIFVDEFLYKGNDEVSKELLSKNFQNPCFCFDYKLSFNNPNSVIQIGKEP